MKRKQKIGCLSGILLLVLFLAGVQNVPVMAMRTELYQNAPADNGRSGGKEKQLLANSYAGEYQIDFSYGFEGKYQDGNHVPIRVTITNESAVAFEGYFVFQIKSDAESIYSGNSGKDILSKLFPGVRRSGDERNSLFTYRFPIYIPANGTVTKSFSAGLLVENTSFCVLSLENGRNDTVYSQEETISSENFFRSNMEVCVVEEETNYGQQLNGITLGDGIYEVEAVSVPAEELAGLAESYSPDVLILLEQSKEELDEAIQKEIDLWQAEGGLLITFSGNEIFAESQRSAFKEAPAEFLKNILDEETTSRLLAKRNTNYQKYYTISDLLENTKVRNRPNTVLYGVLILVYLVLAGPGLYFLLKRTGKRQYLWGAICACSAVFVVLISLFGRSTRLKAPVLTYVREIWNYDTYQKDYINFCAQAPYNASYELYLDPSYDLVTYNRMDYISNSTVQPETEEAAYEKTEISFGEQKNRAEISSQAAFSLNEFGMQRMEALDEAEGLKGTFHFWDQKISGAVENKTGYDLEHCVLAVPGYCAFIGDIKNGETITLDEVEADSVRDFGNWSAAGDLPNIEKNYLEGVIYNHMPNRSDNCLFFGKLADNNDAFQLDSGYEAYGISYYYQEVSVNMKEGDIVYCPYAQEYSGWDGGTTLSFDMGPNSGGISEEETEVTYYLNGIFEKNNIWRLYGTYAGEAMQQDSEGIYDPAFWPYAMTALEDRIRAAETGGGGKRGTVLSLAFEKVRADDETKVRNFDGTIELYNFQTGTYDEIANWQLDFESDPALEMQYVNGDNQIRVRYRLSEEKKGEEYHENYGYYEAPNLIVKAKEIPSDQYLEKLLAEEPNADTEN
ncbi:hypothetical protein [Fusicatenibacter sp.]